MNWEALKTILHFVLIALFTTRQYILSEYTRNLIERYGEQPLLSEKKDHHNFFFFLGITLFVSYAIFLALLAQIKKTLESRAISQFRRVHNFYMTKLVKDVSLANEPPVDESLSIDQLQEQLTKLKQTFNEQHHSEASAELSFSTLDHQIYPATKEQCQPERIKIHGLEHCDFENSIDDPITRDNIEDPVFVMPDQRLYDRKCITKALSSQITDLIINNANEAKNQIKTPFSNNVTTQQPALLYNVPKLLQIYQLEKVIEKKQEQARCATHMSSIESLDSQMAQMRL